MSKITFLGTGAADYVKPVEGEMFRKFSHTMINDDLLIDAGMHTYRFEDEDVLNTRFSGIKSLLITHTHVDHFYPDAIRKIAVGKPKINMYIDVHVAVQLPPTEGVYVVPVDTGLSYPLDGGYTLHAFPSNHSGNFACEVTRHYVIDTPDGKSVFYGLDGAWLMNAESDYMRAHPVDMMVLDCTVGHIDGDVRGFSHGSIPMIELMLQSVKNCGMVKKGGIIVADHLARTLHEDHESVCRDLGRLGVTVAYDGLCIDI